MSTFQNNPSTRSGHQARKRFGQNFLTDTAVINRIADSINPTPGELLVEIGPGLGALTLPLLERCKKLTVIELDRDLASRLEQKRQPLAATGVDLVIHQTDALKFDFSSLLDQKHQTMRIAGNLPYNISSPMLFHLLPLGSKIKDMHFMLQKEVVDRMVADPGSKIYGRLSVMVQARCRVEALFDVPPQAFNPVPKVESTVVCLQPNELSPGDHEISDALSLVVRSAFAQRRKTLRNSVQKLLTSDDLENLDINPSARPETLSVQQFLAMARAVHRGSQGTSQ